MLEFAIYIQQQKKLKSERTEAHVGHSTNIPFGHIIIEGLSWAKHYMYIGKDRKTNN